MVPVPEGATQSPPMNSVSCWSMMRCLLVGGPEPVREPLLAGTVSVEEERPTMFSVAETHPVDETESCSADDGKRAWVDGVGA
ncbi:hypothetical protein GCM10017600_83310 [Streptosporangium carneum]|uniref:Uncharacterized protein n=1 Tax=Streptosporangium carneum TaxID=47481 RepID=A0A9W6IC09_9ACTN|nr:hypothetical protein GCM10017600_83310 [Streptosporangium carneum]